jgi:hypothetical protein
MFGESSFGTKPLRDMMYGFKHKPKMGGVTVFVLHAACVALKSRVLRAWSELAWTPARG